MENVSFPSKYYRALIQKQLAIKEPLSGNLVNLEDPYDYQNKVIEDLIGSSDHFELSGDKAKQKTADKVKGIDKHLVYINIPTTNNSKDDRR